MKNKSVDNNIYNGIKIVNSINLSVPKTKKTVNMIPLVIIAFFGIYGTVCAFFSMFHTNVDIASIRYYTILFTTVFTVLFMLPKKFHLAIIPVVCIYGFLLYKKWAEFIIGFKMLFNQVYSCIYPNAGKYFKIKSYKNDNMELFLIFAIFMLAALVCYIAYVHSDFLICFLVTFPILEIGLYFGKSPHIIYSFMLVIFWISMLALSCCGYYQKFTKNKLGFIRKNNAFIAKPGIRFQTAGISVSIIAAACTVIFILTLILSSVTNYKRPESINNLRSDLKLAASEFSFENFSESLERFSAVLGIGKTKLYSHKLGNVGKINFNNSIELTVETDGEFDTDIYLKGFTGSVYAGNEWVELLDNVYAQNRMLFDSFKDSNLFPQNMLTNYFNNRYANFPATMHITSDYKNEKYNYTPYISVPTRKVDYINDTAIEFEDKNDYSFKVNRYQINLDNLNDISSEINRGINEFFSGYSDFVYQNYLSVPDTEEMREVYKQFTADYPIHPDYSTYQMLSNIKSFLAQNAEYTLNPGRTPGSEDFVNYFLLKNHKGFCVHFATSGVILARMSGIPARYVEGYVLRTSDFNSDNLDNGIYTVDITDNRAHAWVEVYIDDLGWVPIEFTPPSAAALTDEPEITTSTSVPNTEATTHTTVSGTKSTHESRKTSDSTPSVSTAAIQNTSYKQTSGKTSEPMSLKFKMTLMCIAAFILILTFIALKHLLAVKHKNNIFNNSTPKDKITFAYECALQLIEFSGVERNNMQYLEFAEYVREQLPEIFSDNSFREVTEIMLKAQMSGIEPDESEINTAVSFYKKLFDEIYRKNNILKKISMKYINNL